MPFKAIKLETEMDNLNLLLLVIYNVFAKNHKLYKANHPIYIAVS